MFRIAVVGAGPAGLTLANLFRTSTIASQISFTVFETDVSPTSRSNQGGTLDLHDDTGLAALRKINLLPTFKKYARYDGDEMFMADKNNTVLVHKGSSAPKTDENASTSDDRPEIDRTDLMSILREALPSDLIRWGYKLQNCTDEGFLSFTTTDSKDSAQTEGPFDLIIGADGAWSKVRPRLTSVEPQYCGISGYELLIAEPSKTCRHVDSMVGKGSYFSNSDGKFLNCQRLHNGSLKVRSWYTCPEHSAKETLDKLGPEGALDEILSRYSGWASELLELLLQADVTSMRVWPCYELPVGHTWQHRKGFTLIGDAASLAAPFSGEGVNKAMRDGLDLVRFMEEKLLPSTESTSERLATGMDLAIQKYEETMFPRARKIQSMTRNHIEAFFTGKSLPSAIPAMIKNMASNHESIWVRVIGSSPLVMGIAYIYFWFVSRLGAAARQNKKIF